MNLVKNFFFILFLILFSAQSSLANKIYYIDVDYIVKNSNKGLEIINNLEMINKKNNDELKKEKQTLLNIEQNIKQKKNILSEEELRSQIADLNKKVNEFNIKKNKINDQFKKKKNEQLNNFFVKIEKLIGNYVKDKSIDLLIDKKTVFVGVSSLDLTNDIIDIVNKNIK